MGMKCYFPLAVGSRRSWGAVVKRWEWVGGRGGKVARDGAVTRADVQRRRIRASFGVGSLVGSGRQRADFGFAFAYCYDYRKWSGESNAGGASQCRCNHGAWWWRPRAAW